MGCLGNSGALGKAWAVGLGSKNFNLNLKLNHLSLAYIVLGCAALGHTLPRRAPHAARCWQARGSTHIFGSLDTALPA